MDLKVLRCGRPAVSLFVPVFPQTFSPAYAAVVLLTVVLLHTVLGSNITTMSVVVPGLMSIGAGVAPPLPLMFLICIAVCSQFLLPFHHVILLLGEGTAAIPPMSCSGLAFPIPLLCFSPYFCSISPGGGAGGAVGPREEASAPCPALISNA